MEPIMFIFGLGLMLVCFVSLAKQSQAVARQKLAIDRSEQFRQELLERDQRSQQRITESIKQQAESIKLQKDSSVRWENVSTESAKLQKETLRAIEEMILQQKETNMILSLLISKSQKSNSNVLK